MRFIYNSFIFLYSAAIHIASLFNSKAKLWVSGRNNIFHKLKSDLLLSGSNPIWFHCASLGEFEQGRPLIEKIKKVNKDQKIILTFFSPSGYEIRKKYPEADHIYYLPLDTPSNAKRFLEIVNPKAAIFIKYEFWFNYLNELKKRNIPTYLVSGIFRKDHYFFKFYGYWFRKQLNSFTYFFLQNENSEKLLNSIGYKNCLVTGDTRFDRVSGIAKNVRSFPLISQFKQHHSLLIAGSTWPHDEKIISEWYANTAFQTQRFKIIIAPHEISEGRISSIQSNFKGKILKFSQANEQNINDADILIIDNIGMLSSLYQYGTIAFIGGGFGKGIHNILEAATFALPVIFGPNYHKFTEAKELIHFGGAFSISDVHEFEKTMILLNDEEVIRTASHISKNYVESRVGATDKIVEVIL